MRHVKSTETISPGVTKPLADRRRNNQIRNLISLLSFTGIPLLLTTAAIYTLFRFDNDSIRTFFVETNRDVLDYNNDNSTTKYGILGTESTTGNREYHLQKWENKDAVTVLLEQDIPRHSTVSKKEDVKNGFGVDTDQIVRDSVIPELEPKISKKHIDPALKRQHSTEYVDPALKRQHSTEYVDPALKRQHSTEYVDPALKRQHSTEYVDPALNSIIRQDPAFDNGNIQLKDGITDHVFSEPLEPPKKIKGGKKQSVKKKRAFRMRVSDDVVDWKAIAPMISASHTDSHGTGVTTADSDTEKHSILSDMNIDKSLLERDSDPDSEPGRVESGKIQLVFALLVLRRVERASSVVHFKRFWQDVDSGLPSNEQLDSNTDQLDRDKDGFIDNLSIPLRKTAIAESFTGRLGGRSLSLRGSGPAQQASDNQEQLKSTVAITYNIKSYTYKVPTLAWYRNLHTELYYSQVGTYVPHCHLNRT